MDSIYDFITINSSVLQKTISTDLESALLNEVIQVAAESSLTTRNFFTFIDQGKLPG